MNLSAEVQKQKAINLCAYSQNKYVHLKFLNFYESFSVKGYIMNKTWSFLTKCIWKLCKIFSFVENSCFCLEKDFLLALTFPFFSDIDAFYNPTLKVNIYTILDPSREVDKRMKVLYIESLYKDQWSNKDFKMIKDFSHWEQRGWTILFYIVMKWEQFHSA